MAIEWSAIYKKYNGLWVALKDDEKTVISSGKTAKEAVQNAHKKGFLNPILAHMPVSLVPFVGTGYEI